jgi:hypothetical protein
MVAPSLKEAGLGSAKLPQSGNRVYALDEGQECPDFREKGNVSSIRGWEE